MLITMLDKSEDSTPDQQPQQTRILPTTLFRENPGRVLMKFRERSKKIYLLFFLIMLCFLFSATLSFQARILQSLHRYLYDVETVTDIGGEGYCAKAHLSVDDASRVKVQASLIPPQGFVKFTKHLIAVGELANHLYIICSECSTDIPSTWRKKTSLIRGPELDKCLKALEKPKQFRTSLSHEYVMRRAIKNGYRVVAIVEEDFMSRDIFVSDVALKQDIRALQIVMQEMTWTTLRLGYRPYFIEQNIATMNSAQGFSCPQFCRCQRLSRFVCIMRDSGCDMRSSDFYLLNVSASHSITRKLQNGEVIDMKAFQVVKNQLFAIPQISYQSGKDQRDLAPVFVTMAKIFADSCLI